MKRFLLILSAAVAAALCLVCCNKNSQDPQGGEIPTTLSGRWNGVRNNDGGTLPADDPQHYGITFFFTGSNDVEIYITVYGHHLYGTYSVSADHKLNIQLRREGAQAAKIKDEYSEGWWAGNMDPITFELADGYNWYDISIDDYNMDVQVLGGMNIILQSASLATSEMYTFYKQQ